MSAPYLDFIAKKAIRAASSGFEAKDIAGHLFPFQKQCVEFALRAGRAGIYLDTGLGKTEIQLEFCQKALEHSGGRALILTPLAVAGQTHRRAKRWGYESRIIREARDAGSGINICNYDRIEKIDPTQYDVVSLDEASLLKNFSGKTTRTLTDMFRHTKYRLCATATPAPNDHMEIGNQAHFLGIMAMNEMLSRFFINDTSTASQEWRLKGHARQAFWDWMASWSRMAERPSDLGDEDDLFNLDPFEVRRHKVHNEAYHGEFADIFGVPSMSATNVHDVKRQTIKARAECANALVAREKDTPFLIWVDTNYEADAMKGVLPDALEIRGSQTIDEKERLLEAFSTGEAKQLIAKPSMCGLGLDWSHCHRMVFVGRSFSYETYYQAVRRCWRFGQKQKVIVDIVSAQGEDEIGRVIDRKSNSHIEMKQHMRAAMLRANGTSAAVKTAYTATHRAPAPSWI